MTTIADRHNPSWALMPCNDPRTAWRPFSAPAILIVPHRRDASGNSTANSEPSQVRISIEGAPTEAIVVGPDHVGMRFPDKELYAVSLSALEIIDRQINVSAQNFTSSDGASIDFADASEGDFFQYTTSSGVTDVIGYLPDADYFDVSDVQVETEHLPPRRYNLIYSCNFYVRITLKEQIDNVEELLCIDVAKTGFAALRFGLNHPGEVIEDMYRMTPSVYLTNASKALDDVIALYRPFTNVLQDLFDEQSFLENVNWAHKVPYEAIPYLSETLGWAVPYFPQSLDKLRRAVLLKTVEFQRLKGSRRAIVELMSLFGFTILINNLWHSSDGQRFIAPGDASSADQITWQESFQVEPALANYNVDGYGQVVVPLLYRPQIISGVDPFKAAADSGNVTVTSYLVKIGSAADVALREIVAQMAAAPDAYGRTAGCTVDATGFINSNSMTAALAGLETVGYSQTLIKNGRNSASVYTGLQPLLQSDGIAFNAIENALSLSFNGYIQFSPAAGQPLAAYVFIGYKRQETITPPSLADLQSNRFNVQILSSNDDSIVSSDVMEFLIDFIFKIKAFHSLLNVIKYRTDQTEVYQVTDFEVGGNVLQRYDVEAGRQQVPPAIIPTTPSERCEDFTLEGLGYKAADLAYRQSLLTALIEEFANWQALSDRLSSGQSTLRLPSAIPGLDPGCLYNAFGQSRTTEPPTDENDAVKAPPPWADSSSAASESNLNLSPVDESGSNDWSVYGDFMRQAAHQRPVHCKLDGKVDYRYQGRVADEILYKASLANDDVIHQTACGLGQGTGVYWTYPTPSRRAVAGVEGPVAQWGGKRSLTRRSVYSGGAAHFGTAMNLTGVQSQMLSVSATAPLPSSQQSFLGRLLRAYDGPQLESVHFSNRPYLDDATQIQLLAIQRPNLNVDQPTMHFPGCRFPTMNKLIDDFTSDQWRAKPWDEPHCSDGRCGVAPDWLNGTVVKGVDGIEELMCDDAPFKAIGNGLRPDVPTFGGQIHGTDVDEDAVVHAVYMSNVSRPATTLGEVSEPPTQLIATMEPLFPSANPTGTAGEFIDFYDGYPAQSGIVQHHGTDMGRGGLYTALLLAMATPGANFAGQVSVLFLAGSGIRDGRGVRLDCGCTIAGGGNPLPCSINQFTDNDGARDWESAKIEMDITLAVDERIGCSGYRLDGSLPSLLEVNVNLVS